MDAAPAAGAWLGLAAGVPGGLPIGIGEPLDRGDHGVDGVGEVVEIDVGEVVGGLVIVGAESVAGDGLGDDSLTGEREVVRAPEEVLFGVGIGDERGPVFGESWAEIAALPSGEPELRGADGGIGMADHLEFEIGDDGGQGNRRVLEKILVSLAAGFLAAEADEEDGAAGVRGERGERAGEFEDSGGAAGIVIGPVVDNFAVGSRAHAEVIEMPAEQDGLAGERGVGAAEQSKGIVGCGARGERDGLELSVFEAEGLELRGDIGGGDQLIVCGAAASAKGVGGEEGHFAVDVGGDVGGALGWALGCDLRQEQRGSEQDEAGEAAEHS